MGTQKVNVDLDMLNVSRINNLPDATLPQQPATKAQLDAVQEGTSWKDEVRVRTASNVNLASPGASLDGVAMSAGDRFLAAAQSTASQNGIYVWNGAAVPATRAPDADTAASLRQATVSVAEGTSASTTWRQTATVTTIGTDTVTWASFGTAAPTASETTAGISELASQVEVDGNTGGDRVVTSDKLNAWSGRTLKFGSTFGDGVETQYDFTHNFNSRDFLVGVYEVASPFGQVWCEVQHLSTTVVRLIFNVAPASNSLRAVARS